VDANLETRLGERLAERIPAAFGLHVRRGDEGLEIVAEDASILQIDSGRGEWTVWSSDGHAHRDSFEEAAELALSLLQGEARFAREYRSDTLASTWIEIWDGDAFEVHDQACFLPPFDAVEWEVWPDDRWRVVRKTLALGTTEGEQTFESPSDAPSMADSPMLGWLETALGPPAEGMRWTVGGQSRFVFQVPRGWRRRPVEPTDQAHNLIDFLSPEPGLLLRARTYFRDAEIPTAHPEVQAILPYSVEPFADDSEGEWSNLTWTLLFSDGEGEMMGVLELFFIASEKDAAMAMRDSIEASARNARFVPGEWDMGADRD